MNNYPNYRLVNVNDNNKNSIMYYIFILIVIAIIAYLIYLFIIYEKDNRRENMSGGTLTQMFAQDSQDVYLKGNVADTATGNFTLYWNQPTKVANTYMNRGSPLSSYVFPSTITNPNIPIGISTELDGANIDIKNIKPEIDSNNYIESIKNPYIHINKPNIFGSDKITEIMNENPKFFDNVDKNKLNKELYYNLLHNKDCVSNPSSCGSGDGGSRLGEDFNQPTDAKPFVSLDGNLFYPDSYVGSYWTQPNFDIMQPYPIIIQNNK